MKNFLRKLHIGDSAAGDGASSPSAPPAPPTKKGGGIEHRHASGLSGWLSSVTGRPPHPPPPPPPPVSAATAAAAALEVGVEESALASSVVEERRAAEEDEERARRESPKEAEQKRRREAETEKKEKQEAELEDYHMQLALEMSVREDPEAMQIEVAKQISLGSCPIQSSPAEVVAFRYWVLSMSTPLLLSSRLIVFLTAIGSHSCYVHANWTLEQKWGLSYISLVKGLLHDAIHHGDVLLIAVELYSVMEWVWHGVV